MNELNQFDLTFWDYGAFGGFFLVLSAIGYLAGQHERTSPDEYFLTGRKLPWYVVGGSFSRYQLPDPDVLAQEIADDLQTALDQFSAIAEDLGE